MDEAYGGNAVAVSVCADAAYDIDGRAARLWLEGHGWLSRQDEHFRVLPPPPMAVWLGSDPANEAAATMTTDGGWTVQRLDDDRRGRVEQAVLALQDPRQRRALLAQLPLPGRRIDGQPDDAAPFAWAHRALCRQGLKLRVGPAPGEAAVAHRAPATAPSALTEPGLAVPAVTLGLHHQATGSAEAPLLVLEIAAGIRCRLVETHAFDAARLPDGVVQNLLIDIRLEEGASLHYLRQVACRPSDCIAHQLQARVSRDARLELATIASGSRYQLQRQQIGLMAPGAVGRSASLVLCEGTKLDQQFRVDHLAADTVSDVEALALGSGAGLAQLDAWTRIAPDAAGAQARQRLNGIPTAGQPRVVMRPHLEILHDQVQAVHGATWGALPEDAIFYARQRGLDAAMARGLIIRGMADALMRRAFSEATSIEALGLEALLADAVSGHLTASARLGDTTEEATRQERRHDRRGDMNGEAT